MIANTKSAPKCIEDNDFEAALYRFNNTTKRWKQYWYETCWEIASKCKKWMDEYIFDPANLLIYKVIKAIKKKPKPQTQSSHVYLIKMYDENAHYRYFKCGKTNNLERRYNELIGSTYKSGGTILDIKEVATWELPTAHLAESFEQLIHHYLSSCFAHIPNDRYEPLEVDEKVLSTINNLYSVFNAQFVNINY